MTDLTDQLDAIQKRANVVRRCMDAAPNDSYDMGDIDEALKAQRNDVQFLLDLARKQQAAIDAVEQILIRAQRRALEAKP